MNQKLLKHTKFSKYDSVVNNVVVSSLFNLEKMMVSVLQVRGLDRPVGRGERRVCWQPPPPPNRPIGPLFWLCELIVFFNF